MKHFFYACALGLFALNSSALAETQELKLKESAQVFTPTQTEAIKTIIHDYLVSSPEVLIEASKALQEKQVEKAQADAEESIKKHFKSLVNDKNNPIMGNPNGDVILVEIVDYQCGHCKSMSAVIDELIKNNKNLKVLVKTLPIYGASSEFAARAALASLKQGQDKFLAFHKALFKATLNSKKKGSSEKTVLDLAKAAGLNESKLRLDMKSASVKKTLTENLELAQSLNLVGVPAFIIANKNGSNIAFIPGAIPNAEKELQKLIDKAAGKKKS